ncbi:site-specific integrase [Oxalobacteraceae sp. CFBP 8753]|nr:site-specific integrase [Oxalobacteraceae sp. CFBP 8753]
MSKVKFGAVEKNIYCEKRRNALRFVVQVSPLPKVQCTVDFEEFELGLCWARQQRVNLLAEKGAQPSIASGRARPQTAAQVIPQLSEPAHFPPCDILIQDMLDSYSQHRLAQLAGSAAEASRLKNLGAWFGHLTLGQLPPSVIEDWQNKRLSGLLGSGRVRKTKMTKHQRHYRKNHAASAVVPLEPAKIAGVSAQTVRHELVLLRRTITAYFREKQLNHVHGAWLNSLFVMTMPLPERPAPRETRLEDDPLAEVLRELGNRDHQCYLLMAIATTLRRSELCSLRWEDVDFVKKEVKLRKLGHCLKKSKVKSRSVPLMPAAIEVLKRLGPKKSGRIFGMTPGGYSQAWRRAADRAGCHEVRLHDMRREGISRLIEIVEAPLQTVMLFSGHSDVGVLQRHYAKPRVDIIVDTLSQRGGADRLLVPALLPAT